MGGDYDRQVWDRPSEYHKCGVCGEMVWHYYCENIGGGRCMVPHTACRKCYHGGAIDPEWITPGKIELSDAVIEQVNKSMQRWHAGGQNYIAETNAVPWEDLKFDIKENDGIIFVFHKWGECGRRTEEDQQENQEAKKEA